MSMTIDEAFNAAVLNHELMALQILFDLRRGEIIEDEAIVLLCMLASDVTDAGMPNTH